MTVRVELRLWVLRAGLLGGAITWAAPEVAQACSCAAPTLIQLPSDGAADVPLNARLWESSDPSSSSEGPPALRLRELDSGTEVDLAMTTIQTPGGITLYAFAAAADLLPQTEYEVVSGSPPTRLRTFTTGSARDDAAPDPPGDVVIDASAVEGEPGNSCGSADSFVAAIEFAATDAITVIDRDGMSTIEDAPDGVASEISSEGRAFLGNGGCTYNWPEASWGTTSQIRLGSFDIAGNFSGWSNRTDVDFEEAPKGCSCATDPGPVGVGMAAALFLLGLHRRRRL